MASPISVLQHVLRADTRSNPEQVSALATLKPERVGTQHAPSRLGNDRPVRKEISTNIKYSYPHVYVLRILYAIS
jgi:hypothetical protein